MSGEEAAAGSGPSCPSQRLPGGRGARAMARRDGGGRALPRLLLWLALWGLRGGSGAGALLAGGAALPFAAGPPAACSPRCQHGGLCLANGTCLCSKGYEGERCQHGNGPASHRGGGRVPVRVAAGSRRRCVVVLGDVAWPGQGWAWV